MNKVYKILTTNGEKAISFNELNEKSKTIKSVGIVASSGSLDEIQKIFNMIVNTFYHSLPCKYLHFINYTNNFFQIRVEYDNKITYYTWKVQGEKLEKNLHQYDEFYKFLYS